jgi:hypothetical protein
MCCPLRSSIPSVRIASATPGARPRCLRLSPALSASRCACIVFTSSSYCSSSSGSPMRTRINRDAPGSVQFAVLSLICTRLTWVTGCSAPTPAHAAGSSTLVVSRIRGPGRGSELYFHIRTRAMLEIVLGGGEWRTVWSAWRPWCLARFLV